MRISFKPKALEDLKKFPSDIQKRIVNKMRFFSETGEVFKFAKPLRDKQLGEFRLRIGDYRVIFDIVSNEEIIIVKIGKRDEIYK